MKILVTGAGGFLGGAIARMLLADGHQVIHLSRRHHPELDKLHITSHQGDLAELAAVENAVKGCEAVIHTASKVSMWGRYDDFYKTNVTGTKNIIHACRKYQVSKLVYTSSPSVVFDGKDLCGVDESTPYPEKYISLYAQTKSLAEKLILKANDDQLATASLRPHLIFGAGDPHILPRLMDKAQKGILKKIGKGANLVDVTHVFNAAEAHLKVLYNLKINSPVCGKAFFLGQERPVVLWDFIDELLSTQKGPTVTSRIPFPLAYLLASSFEAFHHLFSLHHKEPPLTRFTVLSLARSHYFSHENARSCFGYHPSLSLEAALRETAV